MVLYLNTDHGRSYSPRSPPLGSPLMHVMCNIKSRDLSLFRTQQIVRTVLGLGALKQCVFGCFCEYNFLGSMVKFEHLPQGYHKLFYFNGQNKEKLNLLPIRWIDQRFSIWWLPTNYLKSPIHKIASKCFFFVIIIMVTILDCR